MKKEIVIELIEDNRLKEAIDLLKKETKDTYLYNQVIVLSASYEDYLKLEITGIEDYSVRTQKRSQLVNGLLYIVDKIVEHKSEHSQIQTPVLSALLDSKYLKNVGIGISLAILLTIFLYLFKNNNDNSTAQGKEQMSKSFDLEVKIVKSDFDSPYTEGGKIKLKIEGSEDKIYKLNAEGKVYITALPINLKDKKLSVQLEDTSFYSLMNQQTTNDDHLKTLKVVAKLQTISFSGRVVHYDLKPAKNHTLNFGNGLAKALTNNNGDYTVDLPKNLANTSIELFILENDKVVLSRSIRVSEVRLRQLKVY